MNEQVERVIGPICMIDNFKEDDAPVNNQMLGYTCILGRRKVEPLFLSSG